MIETINNSKRLTAVLDKVRALGPTLRERALDAERAGRHSSQTIADLDGTGAFDIGSPAEFGGYEFSVRQQLDVITEVAKWDGSCGWTVWVGASTNWIPAGSGARNVEEVFGSEWVGPRVAASSHFPASRGRARRVEGGWEISGGPWTFGSDSLWAPFTNLGCIADDGDGPYLVGVQVPREELDFHDDWKVAGMRATGSVSSSLSQGKLVVPDYRVVDFRDVTGGILDSGLTGSLWKAPTLGWAFSLMAGMSVGIARGALDRFLERSSGRPIRGTTYKNQLEAPLTHLMLTEVHTKIQSAALMAQANAAETDRLGELAAAGTPADPDYLQLFSTRVLAETAYAAKWCAEAIELLQRNSGSTAIMDFEPIQRAWRDARVITLHGALNLEALSENFGRIMAGTKPHEFEGITTLDRFAPVTAKR
ncbi:MULTISPECIES: acyl-CoA dehydrogenase family protein [unclassified Rhodococcus (in: high G+C Gram-positive bacteria)]|uniref:acyl-CoA dehydrogenase family protein n=1 Tax=unclassified Rhodococcus (in: high G+C Gram-positive bacteria) TaxID=192944 RepID=UPI00144523D9|nr:MULTISPECIES: acyl-CoA dehydrogenase family protein [unclassified Rhodococcus (in: high G+C Gram-positive bacteria)]